jgi:hypothetical protein
MLELVGLRALSLPPLVHFLAVGLSACAATFAALTLSAIGTRRRDAPTVLVGTAFATMGALLAVHGYATPGIIAPRNGLVSFSAGATIPVGGVVLALAVLPGARQLQSIPLLLALQATLVGSIAALAAAGMTWPSLVPPVPKSGSIPWLSLLAAGMTVYVLLAFQAAHTFLLTRRGTDLLVVLGTVWLGASLFAALHFTYRTLGWWIGHLLELLGIALIALPVVLDLRRTAQSRPLAGDLSGAELVQAEEEFLGSRVRALTLRLAEKDSYSEQHTRRVALRAVQVGEELGLPPGRLRALAIGGLVHDIGKLSVADSILKKPDALDAEEFAVIRRHPEWGYELLGELGGFSHAVRRLVLDHHERLDGKGYPRGLEAQQIDLETRILTVCDVYDALLSTRVYRAAWTHDRAIDLLREECGNAFDPECVAALERVLGREAIELQPAA